MDTQFSITRNSEINLAAVLLVALSLVFAASIMFSSKPKEAAAPPPVEVAYFPFPNVSIVARAAYVYDIRNDEVMFAKNEDVRLPLASLTKVMSALAAESLSPTHGTVTITAEALEMVGDSGLFRNEKWSLRDILDFSMVTSSNDGMRAVALALGALERADVGPQEIVSDFVGEMNRKASELGLKNTYFWNETGLDESDVKGGAYGTARDMSELMGYILENHPEIFHATREPVSTFQSLDNNFHLARNTNPIVSEIPGLLASKTGFTNTAGGNLAVIFDPELGRPIVISVLGSTSQGRFDDMRALVGATMEYIINN